MTRCPTCSSEISDDSRFCSSCGESLSLRADDAGSGAMTALKDRPRADATQHGVWH